MTKRLYGRSSEKHMVQSDGQLDFFNEIELEADRQAEEEFSYETEPEETEKDDYSGAAERPVRCSLSTLAGVC